jgi:hypothetical protein
MANEVYANGREIACKAGDGKTICAFPDVCFTPPENPATPPGVPVPYPNTGFDSNTTEGSKTVMISGKEVMLKHTSYFKTLSGDEAGCAAKKGVITSTNRGKVYFEAWSMDVKFEGENVDRHLDLTTTNHASDPGDAPPWPFQDGMASPTPETPCEEAARMADQAENTLPPTLQNSPHVVAGGSFVPSSGFPGFPNVGPTLGMMSASCISGRMVRPRGIYERFARGNNGGPSPCGDNMSSRDQGHAEVKMIEDIFNGRIPGLVTTNGYIPQGKLSLSVLNRPICCSCQRIIRCAEQRGLEIEYCSDSNGNPITFDQC